MTWWLLSIFRRGTGGNALRAYADSGKSRSAQEQSFSQPCALTAKYPGADQQRGRILKKPNLAAEAFPMRVEHESAEPDVRLV